MEPIAPKINSLAVSTLYKGYSANATADVENASWCTAELLLYPPEGFEAAPPSALKDYAFWTGSGLDYFYRKSESWSWSGILFPQPTDVNTAAYNVDLRLSCHDYYNSSRAEKIQKLPTSAEVLPSSLSISFAINESGSTNAMVTNQVWTDFTCRLLVGDQANSILEERSFDLGGRQSYEFNLDKYNRSVLQVTAICQDSQGRPITKIGTFRKE